MTTIAIVGQGYMGRTHAEAWATLGLADRIKYVSARTPGEPLEHAPVATFVTDLETVLRDPEVDVVSICTPTSTHRDIAVRALEAGKNVLLEKPFALSVSDALAVQQVADRCGTVLMVAQVVRFFEGYRRLRTDVAGGKLGEVLSARARRFINRPDWAQWWHDDAQSGGMVVDFAIHDYDQMNLFLGEPIRVSCIAGSRLGPVETTIEYRNGGIGQVLSFADLKRGAPFNSSIGLVGTEGFADYEFSAGSPTDHPDVGTSPDAVSRYRLAAAGNSTTADISADAPYTRQVEYFLRCVTDGAKPGLCTTPSAIRALEVSLAASESLTTGAPVRVHSVVSDDAAAGTTSLPWSSENAHPSPPTPQKKE